MPAPIGPDDDGLAPERTALAWNRTGIAFIVAIMALGRRVWPLDEGNHGIVVAVLGLAALLFVGVLATSSRLATHSRYHGHTMPIRAFRLLSATTFALALAGFVLAFFPP